MPSTPSSQRTTRIPWQAYWKWQVPGKRSSTSGCTAWAKLCTPASRTRQEWMRRFGSTQEGAILDMEADQFTVLLLSLLIVRDGGLAHVLLVPATRYVFVVVMWMLRLPAHDPKPVEGDNRRGRLCCAVVVAALLAALWPGMPGVASDVLTAAAVLVLTYSFSSDARFLVSRMRSARAVP